VAEVGEEEAFVDGDVGGVLVGGGVGGALVGVPFPVGLGILNPLTEPEPNPNPNRPKWSVFGFPVSGSVHKSYLFGYRVRVRFVSCLTRIDPKNRNTAKPRQARKPNGR
jgi:hypothetical protein